MRSQMQVARPGRGKRTRRALQFATCVSVLVLSCSVYDADLLRGRVFLGSTAGTAGEMVAGAGNLPGNGDAAPNDDAHAGEAGEQSQASGGASSAGEAGLVDRGTGGSQVVVTYGGATDGGAAGKSSSGGGGAAASAGGSGASGGGAAGQPPVVKELAKNKRATASSFEGGNEVAKGNDGDSSTRWCAAIATLPQWFRIDLGDTHALSYIVLKFERTDSKYTYVIETSSDDAVFAERARVDGIGDTQQIGLLPGVSARYVRITISAADSYKAGNGTIYPTWASFWEMRVFGY